MMTWLAYLRPLQALRVPRYDSVCRVVRRGGEGAGEGDEKRNSTQYAQEVRICEPNREGGVSFAFLPPRCLICNTLYDSAGDGLMKTLMFLSMSRLLCHFMFELLRSETRKLRTKSWLRGHFKCSIFMLLLDKLGHSHVVRCTMVSRPSHPFFSVRAVAER
jgi:hypothetical protein